MSNLFSPGENAPDEVNVVIEIPAYSEPVKYELDKDTNSLVVDRFMATCMQYPANYGFVPQTLSEDGDPVDVLVVSPHPIHPGAMIRCRPVGVLNMEDESGMDAKIIAVPIQKLTPLYDDIQQSTDLPTLLLQQIEHFFTHYKDLEPNKWVKIQGWENAEDAKHEIQSSIARYLNQQER